MDKVKGIQKIKIPTINERLKLKSNPIPAKPKTDFNKNIKRGSSKVSLKIQESPSEIPPPARKPVLNKCNPLEPAVTCKRTAASQPSRTPLDFKSFPIYKEPAVTCKRTAASQPSRTPLDFKSLPIYKSLSLQISEFNNQRHEDKKGYSELTMCIEIGIQECLTSNYGLQELYLPLGEVYESISRCKILISPHWQTAEKLLVLIQGAGQVGPGIWSRSVCVNSSLEIGTMVPFVQKAIEENYSVIILNPNDTSGAPYNQNRAEHGEYIWTEFIRKCKADLYIVAHSCGGYSVSMLLDRFWDEFKVRVKGLALTDAIFSESEFYGEKINFLSKIAKHWESSGLEGNQIKYGSMKIPTVSAGHPKHEYATGCAFPYIFPFFSSLN